MKANLLKHSLIYGLITGGGLIIFMFILATLGNGNISGIKTGLTIVMSISAVLIAVRKYRDFFQAGIISFGQAFKISLIVCIAAAIPVAVYTFFELAYINPGFIDQMLLETEDAWLKMGMEDTQVELASKIMLMIATPSKLAFLTFIRALFWGTILSLIIGATLKREGNPLINHENE